MFLCESITRSSILLKLFCNELTLHINPVCCYHLFYFLQYQIWSIWITAIPLRSTSLSDHINAVQYKLSIQKHRTVQHFKTSWVHYFDHDLSKLYIGYGTVFMPWWVQEHLKANFLFFHDLSASFKIVYHDYALLTHNLDSKE